jgi:hypothetical protein
MCADKNKFRLDYENPLNPVFGLDNTRQFDRRNGDTTTSGRFNSFRRHHFKIQLDMRTGWK